MMPFKLSNCAIVADAIPNLIEFRRTITNHFPHSKPNFDVKGRLISKKRPAPRAVFINMAATWAARSVEPKPDGMN